MSQPHRRDGDNLGGSGQAARLWPGRQDARQSSVGRKARWTIALSKDNDVFHIQTDKTTIRNLIIVEKDKKPFTQDAVKLIADVFLDTKEKTIAAKQFNLEGTDGQAIIRITQAQIQQKADKTTTQMNGKIDAEVDLGPSDRRPDASGGLDIADGKDATGIRFEMPDKPAQLAANLNLAPTTIGFDKPRIRE
jgi:hypothetical protein